MNFESWYNLGIISNSFEELSNNISKGSYRICKGLLDRGLKESPYRDNIVEIIVNRQLNWSQAICLLDILFGRGKLNSCLPQVYHLINMYDKIRPSWSTDNKRWNDFVLEEISWKELHRNMFKPYEYDMWCRVACLNRYLICTLNKENILSFLNDNFDYIYKFSILDKCDVRQLEERIDYIGKRNKYKRFGIEYLAKYACNIPDISVGLAALCDDVQRYKIGDTFDVIIRDLANGDNISGGTCHGTRNMEVYRRLLLSDLIHKRELDRLSLLYKYDLMDMVCLSSNGTPMDSVYDIEEVGDEHLASSLRNLLYHNSDCVVLLEMTNYYNRVFWGLSSEDVNKEFNGTICEMEHAYQSLYGDNEKISVISEDG